MKKSKPDRLKGIKKESMEQTQKQHSDIREQIKILQASLPYLKKKESYPKIKEVLEYFKKYLIEHIRYEEELFSIALVIGDIELKKLIRQLQKEHIDMLGKYDKIEDIILKYGFDMQDEKLKAEFIELTKGLISDQIAHAHLEDEQLFPFLRQMSINVNLDVD